MRVRRSILVLILATTTAMVGTAAMAHHPDEEGQYSGVDSTQWTELASVAQSAPCEDGMAAGMFPCDGIDLMSFIPHGALGTTFANDMWGWTDPQTGRDYAVMGAGEGTVFVDITNPESPAVLGILPTHTSDNFFWRDIKVYADHAFIVSEDNGHGMQVFDLTELRDWDGNYTAHNLNINEDTGFAYAVGVRQKGSCSGGLHMIDISDPINPTFAGCWGGDGYIHDTQCVIYEGPDADYQGREICFNSNAQSRGPASLNRVSITDVTDKSNPVR
jgi:choice-of-anchor B domain-containing protein